MLLLLGIEGPSAELIAARNGLLPPFAAAECQKLDCKGVNF